MPAADREKARRWTANQVRQLITDSPLATPRYELVDGELLVTPSPVGQHQRAVALLLHALLAYLEQYPVAAAFSSPSDVELEHGTIVQPDVYVVPLHEARRILNQSPVRELLVAAEVISPSSRRFDRGTKRLLYGRHVPEYWIVDLDDRIVERSVPNDERRVEILADVLDWHAPGAAEPFRLELPAYFRAVFLET